MKKTKGILICIISLILLSGCTTKTTSMEDGNHALYQSALSYIEEKQYLQAIGVLTELGDYRDSKDIINQIRYVINASYISAGYPCIGAVTSDLGVLQINANEDALSKENWKNIYYLSSQGGYLDGINSDGTIITTNPNTPESIYENINNSIEPIGAGNSSMYHNAKTILNFKNVKAFISSYPTACAVLTKDHIIETALQGFLNDEALSEISGWKDIVSIAGFLPDVVGLKSDGTIAYLSSRDEGEKEKIATWNHIVAISEGTYLFGLKTDGNVVSSGSLKECKTETWKDIIAISSSRITTVGLKRDGTVVAIGDNYFGQCNVENWSDIVAVAANEYYTLGLTVEGTLVTTTNTSVKDINIPDVTNISDLYVPTIISVQND